MRIAVVADSHLAERSPECVANWRAVRAAVARLRVDLTVHLGDVSLDGAVHPEELAFAAACCARWPGRLLGVAGNHDLGNGSGEEPVDPERVAAYERCFGPSRWTLRCAGGWQLVGIDAQLLGSGTTHEADQDRWLQAELEAAPDVERRVLFLHRPIHRAGVSESQRAGRYVEQAAADRLRHGPLQATLRAAVSGHTHQALDRSVTGVRHVWVPSTAFVLPDEMQARVGEKVVGLGVIELDGATLRYDLLCPDGVTRHRLDRLGFFA